METMTVLTGSCWGRWYLCGAEQRKKSLGMHLRSSTEVVSHIDSEWRMIVSVLTLRKWGKEIKLKITLTTIGNVILNSWISFALCRGGEQSRNHFKSSLQALPWTSMRLAVSWCSSWGVYQGGGHGLDLSSRSFSSAASSSEVGRGISSHHPGILNNLP